GPGGRGRIRLGSAESTARHPGSGSNTGCDARGITRRAEGLPDWLGRSRHPLRFWLPGAGAGLVRLVGGPPPAFGAPRLGAR
ncbi:hypothetical protein, partial [Embleya sp. NPDC055610]